MPKRSPRRRPAPGPPMSSTSSLPCAGRAVNEAPGQRGRRRCRGDVGPRTKRRSPSTARSIGRPSAPSASCRYASTSGNSGTTRRRYCGRRASREAALGPPLQRGRDVRAVHGLRGLHHRLPPRRPEVRRPGRGLQAVEGRRGRRPHRLHPRREGLHHVHPGLPALSHLGDRDRHVPLRAGADARRGGRDLRGHRPGPGHRPRGARRRARTAGSSRPSSSGRSSTTSSTPPWCRTSRATAHLEGGARPWPAPGPRSWPRPGSRYTYSANTLAYPQAIEAGAERIALVGMSCQASVPAVMKARKAGKVARRLALSIGLLCSKTFDDAIFPELFEAKYGLAAQPTSPR